MMKVFKASLYFFILLTFISCDNSWHLSELYIQKIENSSKVIYKYDAWGGRDSHIFGYTLLDSTQVFNIDNVNRLSFSSLETIPTKKLILGIDDDQSDYTKTPKEIFVPIKIVTKEENGIKIKTKIYQYRGYSDRSGGLQRYQFDTFKETRDSIFFYNLNDVESLEKSHLDTLKFKKTNIYIDQKSPNVVLQIKVEDLKLSSKSEIISNINYVLTPKTKTLISSFSNLGIFKKIKIKKTD